MRKIKFQTGEYYHVYNRGVDKREIFSDKKDYLRFLRSMKEFNSEENIESLYQLDYKRRYGKDTECPIGHSVSSPLVKLIGYSLLSNHYHFLLKQLVDRGTSKFLHKLEMGYAKYFNYRNKRTGSLFQGPYQAVEIKSDGQLWRLSAYINGNPEIHKIAKAEKWPWSSYLDYLGKREGMLCDKKIVLNQFENIRDYQEFVNKVIKNSSEIKDETKKYLLERH